MSITDLINGKPPEGLEDLLTSLVLSAGRPFYKAGLSLHRALYNKGIKKVNRLSTQVVCIGNLTWGGSGKTPVTILAARLLSEAGKKVVILSRGYKRKSKGKDIVLVSDEQRILSNPKEAGDEPFLMAVSLPGIPIVVGADRFKTGSYAIRQFAPDIILLDDGFQHWGLARDCDIVCIDSQKPMDTLRLLPRGPLREPISGLSRAQAVIFTRTENALRLKEQEQIVRKFAPSIPILKLRYILEGPVPISEIETVDLTPGNLSRKHVLLFCGLANPESFFRLAEKKIPHVEKKIAFPDHVKYNADRLHDIKNEFVYYQCDVAITTEKDAVKLKSAGLPRMPIYYFGLKTEFEEKDNLKQFLSLLLEAKKS
jgi:tetraacyldisaccharide 4'-kinase